jgi:hypothetical protein
MEIAMANNGMPAKTLSAVTLKDSPASPAVFLTKTIPAAKLTDAISARIRPVSINNKNPLSTCGRELE